MNEQDRLDGEDRHNQMAYLGYNARVKNAYTRTEVQAIWIEARTKDEGDEKLLALVQARLAELVK